MSRRPCCLTLSISLVSACSGVYFALNTNSLPKKGPPRSNSGPHFPAFGLNTTRYGVSIRIQSKCGKMRTKVTPNMETFHIVVISYIRRQI